MMHHLNSETAAQNRLPEIDKVYSKLQSYASIEERIKYCKSVIERTKIFVNAHGDNVTDHIRKNLADVVNAAVLEINSLLSKKTSC